MTSQSEKTRLENISNVSLSFTGVNLTSVKYLFEIARRLLQTSSL
jgi:hypothetical protein